MIDTDHAHLRRELLTYLGSLPHTIKTHGNPAMADVALKLGNCLVWIAAIVEKGEPILEQPITETPTSVHALGKHFRSVALELMDSAKSRRGDVEASMVNFDLAMRAIETRLGRLEAKGGAN